MRPGLRPAIVLVAIAFLAWVTWGVVHAGSDVPPPVGGSGPSVLKNGELSGRRIDGKAWNLDYTAMTLGPDGQTAEIEGVRHGRIDKDGKPYMSVKADHISANQTSGDFVVRGPVTFSEIDGKHRRTIETTDASYIAVTKHLDLPHEVHIASDGGTLTVAHAALDFKTGDLHLGRIVATK